jgi:hypothetical protein
MAKTKQTTDEVAPEPHAPKTREEIVEENRHQVPISNSREKLMADSGAARERGEGSSRDAGPASEFEELTGRSSERRSSPNSRFVAYALFAFGILIVLLMIGMFAR